MLTVRQCGAVFETGGNPDIVSAHSYSHNQIQDTEACEQKKNEIKKVPVTLERMDLARKTVAAGAMSMHAI